ncbi:MAG: class I SAM-dependent methyltransferase [Planctomycetota bacterium]|nr:class I SAM-dependent methyltransferase [Planctomycetota bacterium]
MHDLLSDWSPLDPAEHTHQLETLLALLAALTPIDAPLLDLGCGSGRIAIPVARMARPVIAVDNDLAALAAFEAPRITKHQADLRNPAHPLAPPNAPPIAAACMLGHTFMLLHEPDVAVDLLTRVRALLPPAGFFAIDAFPAPLWADVADGAWQTGVSEDGLWQMIWAEADNVIALRHGDAVDEGDWTLRPDDTLLRLWSMGELTLLARLAGFRPPQTEGDGGLLVFRPAA